MYNHCLGHILTSASAGPSAGMDECETAAGKSAAGSNSGVISMFCPPASQGKYFSRPS